MNDQSSEETQKPSEPSLTDNKIRGFEFDEQPVQTVSCRRRVFYTMLALSLIVHASVGAVALRWPVSPVPAEPQSITMVVDLVEDVTAAGQGGEHGDPAPDNDNSRSGSTNEAVPAISEQPSSKEPEQIPTPHPPLEKNLHQASTVQKKLKPQSLPPDSINPRLKTLQTKEQAEGERTKTTPPDNQSPLAAPDQKAETSGQSRDGSATTGRSLTEPSSAAGAAGSTSKNSTSSESTSGGTDGRSVRSSEYSKLLIGQLNRHKEYPLLARKRGIEGTVMLRLALDRQGELKNYAVERSSGFTLLDDSALVMAKVSQPYPPIPASLDGREFVFVVPVSFRLR